MRLEGKVALVTGSTRGIGRTIAEMFAEEGAKVVLSGRSADKGEKNAQRIRDAGGEAIFVPLDVADETSVQAAVAATVEAYGPITTLINNAAPTALVNVSFKPVTELSTQEWDDIVRGGVRGAGALGVQRGEGGGEFLDPGAGGRERQAAHPVQHDHRRPGRLVRAGPRARDDEGAHAGREPA